MSGLKLQAFVFWGEGECTAGVVLEQIMMLYIKVNFCMLNEYLVPSVRIQSFKQFVSSNHSRTLK